MMRGTLKTLQAVLVLLGLVAFVGGLGALALVNKQVSIQVDKPSPPVVEIPTHLILAMYGVNGTDFTLKHGKAAFAELLSCISEAWLAIIGIVLSFGPSLAAWTILLAWRLGRGVQVYRIRTEGKEDLELMGKYITKVENAVIYSGDFSWLNPVDEKGVKKTYGQRIREQLGKLNRNKLVLVSDKDRATVEREMGDAFKKFENHLVFDHIKGLRCSFVRFGSGSYVVLNLIRTPVAGTKVETTVSVLTGDAETKGVLRTLELCLDRKPA